MSDSETELPLEFLLIEELASSVPISYVLEYDRLVGQKVVKRLVFSIEKLQIYNDDELPCEFPRISANRPPVWINSVLFDTGNPLDCGIISERFFSSFQLYFPNLIKGPDEWIRGFGGVSCQIPEKTFQFRFGEKVRFRTQLAFAAVDGEMIQTINLPFRALTQFGSLLTPRYFYFTPLPEIIQT